MLDRRVLIELQMEIATFCAIGVTFDTSPSSSRA
jgi:hypothetical protein